MENSTFKKVICRFLREVGITKQEWKSAINEIAEKYSRRYGKRSRRSRPAVV